MFESILYFLLAVILAPFCMSLIARTKAAFAGRQGPPWRQPYGNLVKLLCKTPVYSTTTTMVFRMAPIVSCGVALMALLFMPMAGRTPLLAFRGDIIVLFYLLGLGRFFTVLAALDTGSPFEGMGAAREAFYGALAEATIFVILLLLQRFQGSMSLGGFLSRNSMLTIWGPNGSVIVLALIALFLVMLVENSRLPVDDPTTHLELTMIHEVMILDHSGPDLALIELGAWLKMLFYAAFISGLIVPVPLVPAWLETPLFVIIVCLLYVLIGVLESITARYKMNMNPKFILTSFALAFFAAILSMEAAL